MKRLYRSRRDTVLGGVAAGMAEYFDIDPTLMRIIWVLVGLAGPGIILYIACWLIVPETPAEAGGTYAPAPGPADAGPADAGPAATGAAAAGAGEPKPVIEFRGRRGAEWLGIGLVIAGGWFLLDEFIPWFHEDLLWPVLLIVAGAFLLVQRRN